jgi:hypothetical protein
MSIPFLAEIIASTKCAWCERPDAKVRPIMSAEHPACDICFSVWWESAPATPELLREWSLGEIGKEYEQMFAKSHDRP